MHTLVSPLTLSRAWIDAKHRCVAATRSNTAFTIAKRTSPLLNAARAVRVSPVGMQASRAYSSEMANAIVQYVGSLIVKMQWYSHFTGSPRTSAWVMLRSVSAVPASVSVSFSQLSSLVWLATHRCVASSSRTPFSASLSSKPSVW